MLMLLFSYLVSARMGDSLIRDIDHSMNSLRLGGMSAWLDSLI